MRKRSRKWRGCGPPPVVEYERVAALKRRALDLIFEANPPGADCEAWIAAEGDLLRLYATYCALDEYLHAENPNLWVWPDWPEPYRSPESDAVKQFAAEHKREILFHGWLQWNIDLQLARVQHRARGRDEHWPLSRSRAGHRSLRIGSLGPPEILRGGMRCRFAAGRLLTYRTGLVLPSPGQQTTFRRRLPVVYGIHSQIAAAWRG